MKLIVIKSHLKEGLLAIERSSGENPNLPILKQVLFETTDNQIKLTATNLEIGVTVTIPGKVIENGKATAPIGLFSGMLSNLQSERLNVEKRGKKLEIKADNYEATLYGLPPEDFPLIPQITSPTLFLEIESAIFKEAVAQVVIATQLSEIRPELSNIFFAYSVEALRFVATDSFRLAEKTVDARKFTSNHKEPFYLLIPLKTCHELLRILKDKETIRLYHDSSQVLFKTETTELISRLAEGSFPDYQAIIPTKFYSELHFNREEFIRALKLAGVFSSKTNEVKVKLGENKKTLEIFSADQALGENTYLLPAKVQGTFKEAVFNCRYLLDGLKALSSEEIYFGLSEENKPALLKDPQEASYFYILMPIAKV